MYNRKLCPMKFSNDNDVISDTYKCEADSCAWFVYSQNIENESSSSGMCALEMIALKKNDGQ